MKPGVDASESRCWNAQGMRPPEATVNTTAAASTPTTPIV
jgi:hypothetical protein